MIASLQERFGCTHRYLLWEESWTNLQMKISDMPRIVRKGEKTLDTDSDIIEFFEKHV